MSSRRDLTLAVGELGHWQQAEHDYRQQTRVQGTEHPQTLATRYCLAWAMANQEHWEDAEAEFRQVLDASTRVIGADHPHTVGTRADLEYAVAQKSRGTSKNQDPRRR